ncbi:MAG: tetratricopeptide repeat protein [Psychromonas sp.]|nr:tetratricopeptide repeat protein [Psychromonas sp.]
MARKRPKIRSRKRRSAQPVNLKNKQVDILFQKGVDCHMKGQLAKAKASYEQVLIKDPKHFNTLHTLGLLALQNNEPAIAVELLNKAIEINVSNADPFLNIAIALTQLNRFEEAVACYDNAIAIQPDNIEALINRGGVLQKLNRIEAALMSYDKAIAIQPKYVQALINRGIALKVLKRFDEALAEYDKAIAIDPNCVQALISRGVTLKLLNRFDESLASYNRALTINPDDAGAWYNLANLNQDMKQYDKALANYNKSIAINPNSALAFNNRGIVLEKLKCYDDALTSFDKAIALNPNNASTLNNRGSVLEKLSRPYDALASFDKAIALNPNFASAFNNRGVILTHLDRLDEALVSYNKAIAINSDDANAFYNRGNALKDLTRLDEALVSYQKAIALNPNNASAFNNLGSVLIELGRVEQALVCYNKAFTISPNIDFLFGIKLHTQMKLCDWSDLSAQLYQVELGVLDGRTFTSPFPLLGVLDNPDLQLLASKIYVNKRYPANQLHDDFAVSKVNDKIRIGYYSSDFYNHATAYLMAELFETHDRQKFEIYGFSFGSYINDEMRLRIAGALDHLYDIGNKRDGEVAKISRELGIDIAVNLKGFTKNARTGIFANHCAPIQVNYLGYPGTMAASYIDYIIADRTLIPQESQQYYSEKVVYLPGSYQVNDSKRKISNKIFLRKDVGLPENSFVFCCFNNSYKILPPSFDGWMRILKAVDHSVLWLLECYPAVAKNLRKEAKVRGVDPCRLIFAKKIQLDDHLARHQLADLFIDTLPCNAHTTASDALWAGLPVLTCIGKSFSSRVAASLLNAMDLSDLITDTQLQYEAKAIELANNPELLTEIKKKLERNRLTSSLFNGQQFARNIEAAFIQMYQRYQSGQVSDHITIEAF